MLEQFRTTELTLDLATQYVPAGLSAHANDKAGRKLRVTITDGGNTVDLANHQVWFMWQHTSLGNSGIRLLNAIDASAGVFECTYPKNMLHLGEAVCSISIADTDSETLTNSLNFIIKIEGAIFDDKEHDTDDDFTDLQHALVGFKGMIADGMEQLSDETLLWQAQMSAQEKTFADTQSEQQTKWNEIVAGGSDTMIASAVDAGFDRNIATDEKLGAVKPDGSTVWADEDGTLHGKAAERHTATSEALGEVKPLAEDFAVAEDGSLSLIEEKRETIAAAKEHMPASVTSEEGIHGMRLHGTEWQVKRDNGEWAPFDGGSGPFVGPAKNLESKSRDRSIFLRWTDPDDEGGAVWERTIVVRKRGGFPMNPTDGDIVMNVTERNLYATEWLEDPGLANSETYYYSLFTLTENGSCDIKHPTQVRRKPEPMVIYRFVIDESVSAGVTLSYALALEGKTATEVAAMWGAREYRCYLDHGIEKERLALDDPNYLTDINGAPVDNPDYQKDIMCAIPRTGWKMSKVGSLITVDVTFDDYCWDEGFCVDAFIDDDGNHNNRFYFSPVPMSFDVVPPKFTKTAANVPESFADPMPTEARACLYREANATTPWPFTYPRQNAEFSEYFRVTNQDRVPTQSSITDCFVDELSPEKSMWYSPNYSAKKAYLAMQPAFLSRIAKKRKLDIFRSKDLMLMQIRALFLCGGVPWTTSGSLPSGFTVNANNDRTKTDYTRFLGFYPLDLLLNPVDTGSRHLFTIPARKELGEIRQTDFSANAMGGYTYSVFANENYGFLPSSNGGSSSTFWKKPCLASTSFYTGAKGLLPLITPFGGVNSYSSSYAQFDLGSVYVSTLSGKTDFKDTAIELYHTLVARGTIEE